MIFFPRARWWARMFFAPNIKRRGGAKMFLRELLKDEFKNWGSCKILLQAPTGMGKTTFVIGEVLPYNVVRGNKILILCNRKLLRKQYWYALVREFERYSDLESVIEIKTYQELAENISNGTHVEEIIEEFQTIVCDEAHYFYSDSDFNGVGTYVLLNELIWATMLKQVIFMSATLDCISNTIEDMITTCAKIYPPNMAKGFDFQKAVQVKKYDYNYLANYDYVSCRCFQELASLTDYIVKSSGKTIIFWDDRKHIEELKEKLMETKKYAKNDIVTLDAQKVDAAEYRSVVENLALANRLVPKVLLTTSVLDNGVSVCDETVENVCIITESKVSFLQMLGRVRATKNTRINLLFLLRHPNHFAHREQQYEAQKEYFPVERKEEIQTVPFRIWTSMWEESEEASAYRRVYVPCRRALKLLDVSRKNVECYCGNVKLVVNNFAYQKNADNFLWESRFHQASVHDLYEPIYLQMQWIGKTPEELIKDYDTLDEAKKKQLVDILMQIKNFSLEELRSVKERIAKEFGSNILGKYRLRKKSFETSILELILKDYGFELVVATDANHRNIYSVIAMGGDADVND